MPKHLKIPCLYNFVGHNKYYLCTKNGAGVYPNSREKVVQVAYTMVSIHRFDRYLGQKFSKWHVYHIYFYVVLLSISCCTGWYKTIFSCMDFIEQYTLKQWFVYVDLNCNKIFSNVIHSKRIFLEEKEKYLQGKYHLLFSNNEKKLCLDFFFFNRQI